MKALVSIRSPPAACNVDARQSGDMPRKLHGIDFIQTTEPDLLSRDVSLYTETVFESGQCCGVRSSDATRRPGCL